MFSIVNIQKGCDFLADPKGSWVCRNRDTGLKSSSEYRAIEFRFIARLNKLDNLSRILLHRVLRLEQGNLPARCNIGC